MPAEGKREPQRLVKMVRRVHADLVTAVGRLRSAKRSRAKGRSRAHRSVRGAEEDRDEGTTRQLHARQTSSGPACAAVRQAAQSDVKRGVGGDYGSVVSKRGLQGYFGRGRSEARTSR